MKKRPKIYTVSTANYLIAAIVFAFSQVGISQNSSKAVQNDPNPSLLLQELLKSAKNNPSLHSESSIVKIKSPANLNSKIYSTPNRSKTEVTQSKVKINLMVNLTKDLEKVKMGVIDIKVNPIKGKKGSRSKLLHVIRAPYNENTMEPDNERNIFIVEHPSSAEDSAGSSEVYKYHHKHRRQRLHRRHERNRQRTSRKQANNWTEYSDSKESSEFNSKIKFTPLKSKSPSYVITTASQLRKDWCRTMTLHQRIVHPGCKPRMIENKFCYGQCNSFYIPKLGRRGRNAEAFQSCAICKPHRSRWVTINLQCSGLVPRVRRKRVLVVESCRCAP